MQSPAYISAFSGLAASKDSTCGDVAVEFVSGLKATVCAALKATLQRRPDDPVRFLAEHLRNGGSESPKDSVHALSTEEGVHFTAKRMRSRCAGGCVSIDATAAAPDLVLPIVGLLRPSIAEVAAAAKRVSSAESVSSAYKPATVHIVVQKDPRLEYVVAGDEILAADFGMRMAAKAISDAHSRAAGEACTAQEGALLRAAAASAPLDGRRASTHVNFNASADAMEAAPAATALAHCVAPDVRVATLVDVLESMKNELGAAKVAVELHNLATTQHPLPLWAYNEVNRIAGLSDKSPMVGVVIVSLNESADVLRALATAFAAALFPTRELIDCRNAAEVAAARAAEAAQQPSFVTPQYWQQVRQRRERRDQVRQQKEEARRLRPPTPEVEAAPQAAPGVGADTPQGTQQLAPTPPSAQAAQLFAARKAASQSRSARRQKEDIEFVNMMMQHRHRQAVRIQAIVRGFIARARRRLPAFFEATSAGYLRAQSMKRAESPVTIITTSAGGNGRRDDAEEKLPLQHKDFYAGPALVRRALYQLGEAHSGIFTTRVPPALVPPRRKSFWRPRRVRIAPAHEDDVSSEGETWEESVVELPALPTLTRPRHFNAYVRLGRCCAVAQNDSLQWALDVQQSFATVSQLQHRAYDAIRQHVVALIHVAHIELVRRGAVKQTDFVKYISSTFWDLPGWFSLPHFVSQSTAPRGSPVPMAYGPLEVLPGRSLYSSDVPTIMPWGPRAVDGLVAKGLMLSPRQSRIYITFEAPDTATWRDLSLQLADGRNHDHIAWFSTLEAPYVYVKGRPFIAVQRPQRQEVDGERTGICCTAVISAPAKERDASTPPLTDLKDPRDRKHVARNWFGVSWVEMERRLRSEVINKIEDCDGKLRFLSAPILPAQHFTALAQFPRLATAEHALWGPTPSPPVQSSSRPEQSRSSSRAHASDINEASAHQRLSLSSQVSVQLQSKGMRRQKSIAAGRSSASMKAQATSNERSPFESESVVSGGVPAAQQQQQQRGSLQANSSSLLLSPDAGMDLQQQHQPKDVDAHVWTPSQAAERDVFPHLGGSFSAAFLRHPMLDVAGQLWLIAFDRFIGTVQEQLQPPDVDSSAIVVAVTTPADMVYGVAAALVSYLSAGAPTDVLEQQLDARRRAAAQVQSSANPQRSATPSALSVVTSGALQQEQDPLGGDSESTVGFDSVNEEGETEADGASDASGSEGRESVKAPDTPRDPLACLSYLRASCPDIDLARAIEDVDLCLDLCEASNALKEPAMRAVVDAERCVSDRATMREHVLCAVRGIERLSWLALLAAYLREIRPAASVSATPALGKRSNENGCGSFAQWCITRAPAALTWIEAIDPWEPFPDMSPDPFHAEYSTQFDRWRQRGHYIHSVV